MKVQSIRIVRTKHKKDIVNIEEGYSVFWVDDRGTEFGFFVGGDYDILKTILKDLVSKVTV